MRYQRENTVIKRVGTALLHLLKKQFARPLTVRAKTDASDIVTSVDLRVDRLVSSALRRAFPNDTILSEESNPDAQWGQTRTWVLDPICGTINLSRQLPLFVTNIALVDRGAVVAAWVVDYSRKRFITSMGEGSVSLNGRRLPTLRPKPRFACIEIDWGECQELSSKIQRRYAALASEIPLLPNTVAYSLASSLSFAYVATGQLDAAITINVNPWDVLAGVFLIEQSGGTVTNFDGSAWSIHSRSFLMAGDRRMHQILLRLIRKHGLTSVK